MRAPLYGENIVRIAFLDEAGRSRQEPIIVVGGILVHGDRTYRSLVKAFDEIAVQFLPKPDQSNFVFHAKDIFHGSGKYFGNRDEWPRERRWPILTALATLPRKFGIPVVFGHLGKNSYLQSAAEQLEAHSTEKDREHLSDIAEHAVAFVQAEIAIERQMREFSRDEICMLIAEDTDRVKKALKWAHSIARDPEEVTNSGLVNVPYLPLVKIEDTPHFADKADSRPLQLADTCAFLIARRLLRNESSQQFFEAIAPQLSWYASDFGDPMGSEQIGGGSLY
jgi:Protein of unknown function (DUF3800)